MFPQTHKSFVVKIHEGFLGGEEAAYSISPPSFASKLKVSIKSISKNL